eukprot:4530932-Pyramimonas_sp.AAC.1
MSVLIAHKYNTTSRTTHNILRNEYVLLGAFKVEEADTMEEGADKVMDNMQTDVNKDLPSLPP